MHNCHHVKSPSGVGARLVRTVAKSFPRRVILTGTLMPKGYEDLWGQMAVIDEDMFRRYAGRSSWTAYRDRYIVTSPWTHAVEGYRHIDELEQVVSQTVFSVTDEQARVGRPAVSEQRVPFELSAKERRAYDDMRRQLALIIGDSTSLPASAMVLSLRLRQLASGFLNMDDGTVSQTGSSRIDVAADLITSTLGEESRVLVFGEFLHDLHRTVDKLRARGQRVELVTGGTSVRERERILAEFGSDSPERVVLVAQVATLGESVNELVSACHGVMLTPLWNRGQWVQALGRLDRTGQTRPVTWWVLEAMGTIDGRVLGALETKGRIETALLDECRLAV